MFEHAWRLASARTDPHRKESALLPTRTKPKFDLGLRAELSVRGLRAAPPLRRRAGAGPSDDGHWTLDGTPLTLPMAADSPWEALADGTLRRDGVIVDVDLAAVGRPRFYDYSTADGVPYEKIARLHGRHVLATTVVQTCVRYAENECCRFCTIEESLNAGQTTHVKLPEQIAEVAQAAVRLDGVRQLVMTTGTSNGRDRGARHLARCVAAVHAVLPDLPIQVQIEPPVDLAWIRRLRAAGTTAIGIHIEALDPKIRRRWTPGKASVPLARYEQAWAEAVRVFGRNRVSTYLLIGLGEDPDELVEGAAPAHQDGRLSVRRALPPARRGAGPRRRRAGAEPRDRRRHHRPRRRARCATRGCAGPTRAPAVPPAARARR